MMVDPSQIGSRAAGTLRGGARRLSRVGRGAGSFIAGKASAVVNRSRSPKDLDDRTLKSKVESEIFRSEDAPKGAVDVQVVDGVVELRGQVKRPEDKKELEEEARAIPEVRDVRNLLHLPNTPAPGRADSPGRLRSRT
jgi:osmotically-inducible protein OsmY